MTTLKRHLRRLPSPPTALFAGFFLVVSLVACFGPAPVAFATPAFDAPPGSWNAKSFGLSLNTEYFSSKANYGDNRGSFKRLANDNSFSNFQSVLKGRYAFKPWVSVFGGTGYGYSKAVDTSTEKTNAQISDVFVGADFVLNRKYLYIIPEIQAGYPVNETDATQKSPLTSDGVPYVRAGIFSHHPFKYFRLGAYLGMYIPTNTLAKRLQYEITADARLFSIFTIGAGFDGYETLMGDQLSYKERALTAAQANAGSMRFYSFDPALMEARAWIGLRPDRSFWIRLGYAKTLDGLYTAEGQSFLISIAYNSTGSTAPGDRPRVDQKQAQKSFQPEVEPTAQGIFDNEELEQPRGDLDQTEKLLEQKNEENR